MTDQVSAGSQQATPQADGPWVQMALFCEKVLTEKDGVLSVVRVIDQVTARGTVLPEKPNTMPPVAITMTAVLAFKAGKSDARNTKHVLTIKCTDPSGKSLDGSQVELPFLFGASGENAGAQVVANMGLEVDETGIYWFDIFVDGQRLTRMPLRISYVTQATGT